MNYDKSLATLSLKLWCKIHPGETHSSITVVIKRRHVLIVLCMHVTWRCFRFDFGNQRRSQREDDNLTQFNIAIRMPIIGWWKENEVGLFFVMIKKKKLLEYRTRAWMMTLTSAYLHFLYELSVLFSRLWNSAFKMLCLQFWKIFRNIF